MRNLFLMGVFSLVGILPSQAQTAVKGRITNEQNGPIEYATVLLRQAQDSALVTGGTTTNAGVYFFGAVKPGQYIVTAQFVGYISASLTLNVEDEKDSLTLPDLVLKEDAQMLKEVVVQGQKPLFEQDGERIILNAQNTVIASGGTAIELLGRAPGVSIDQNDQITLNGRAGVTVMIDGKMTYLPATELAAMLRSMNANHVASVEIIANPTTRYDAAGNSGIINIILKKNSWEGFNASTTLGGGYGQYGKVNASTNLNYRSGKWNHYLNYGYSFNRRFAIVEIDRQSIRDHQTIYFQQQSDRIQEFSASTWQAGSEYQWNDRNTITLSTSGSLNDRNVVSETSTRILSDLKSAADSTLSIGSNQDYAWHTIAATMGYKHQFKQKGHELTMDIDYSNYKFSLNDVIDVSEYNQDASLKNQYTVLTEQPTSFDIFAARVDYVKPLTSTTTLELGAKHSRVNTVSDVLYTNNQHGEYEPDPVRSNDFRYEEEISAGYFNIKTRLAGVTTQVGLRAEQTAYTGHSEKEDSKIARRYFRLFPNINLSREFSKNYRMSLSYSHRIDRPGYNDLYPFVYFLDPFSGQQGNPLLLPQLTHNLQLSQTIAKDYTITFGYNNVTQYMAYVIVLNDDRVSGYATRKNLDNHYNYSVSAMAPIRVGSRWTINASLNIFYNRFNTELFNEVYTLERLSGLANISQTITLPWGLTGEVTSVYAAPNTVGLFQNKAMGSLNVGLLKQLLDKKLSVRLNITDIFQTNRLRNSIIYPDGFDMKTLNQVETRVVRLNVTYNFGKNSGKSIRKRSAQEDEQKRISTGN